MSDPFARTSPASLLERAAAVYDFEAHLRKRDAATVPVIQGVPDETPEDDPIVVPVDPSSVAAFTSDEIVFKLRRGMREMRQTLEGKKDDPQHETAGLIQDGDDLAHELYKVSLTK